jgi:hypothetical protein
MQTAARVHNPPFVPFVANGPKRTSAAEVTVAVQRHQTGRWCMARCLQGFADRFANKTAIGRWGLVSRVWHFSAHIVASTLTSRCRLRQNLG